MLPVPAPLCRDPAKVNCSIINNQLTVWCGEVCALVYWDCYKSFGAVAVSSGVGEGGVVAAGEEDIQFIRLQVEDKCF